MEASEEPDTASFSYMLPNNLTIWGPYCSDCLNSWHSDSFLPRDILIFPHNQGKSEVRCLSDLELENGFTNPFTSKESLSDSIPLNCSERECPNSDRFVTLRSTTMKHEKVETIRLYSMGLETLTDKLEPSVKTVSTNTAAIVEVKPEKNFPFLFGHIKAADPMTETQTRLELKNSQKAYQKKGNAVLNEILSKFGYRIQSCVVCSASFLSFNSMISHILGKSHINNVLKANRRFSHSQDLRVLRHLFLDMDIMKSDKRNLIMKTGTVCGTMKVEPKAKIAVKTPAIANPQKKTSGKGFPPKTAASGQPEQWEKKEVYPFLTGRRNHSDPISVSEETEVMTRLKKDIIAISSIMDNALIKQGYKPTNCVLCGIDKNLGGPGAVIAHALSDDHRIKVHTEGFEFSRSKDLKELEKLYEMVGKGRRAKRILGLQKIAEVVVREPNTVSSGLGNKSSQQCVSSNFSPRQVDSPNTTTKQVVC